MKQLSACVTQLVWVMLDSVEMRRSGFRVAPGSRNQPAWPPKVPVDLVMLPHDQSSRGWRGWRFKPCLALAALDVGEDLWEGQDIWRTKLWVS